MLTEMPAHSSNSSLKIQNCFCSEILSIQLIILIIGLLIVPLVGFMVFARCRKQQVGSSRTSSHIDIFTYNVVFLDLVGSLAVSLMYFGSVTYDQAVWNVGAGLIGVSVTGHTLFHVLTCIERYLAVVHPVFYLRLRGSKGSKIRNILIGCIWLTGIAVPTITMGGKVSYQTTSLVLLTFTFVAFFFCSLSVLCALNRPGPGEAGGNRERTDQSKRRAFQTMVMITGTLSLRFVNCLIASVVQMLWEPYGYMYCVVGWFSLLFLFPSSLVLPLLFLQRMGKLPACGCKADESA